jgi:hypothetical protein
MVMSLQVVRSALLWCTIINDALLVVWFVMLVLPHEWLDRIWRRWFHVSDDSFDAMNLAGISLYKIGILLFNLVPCLALWIVG